MNNGAATSAMAPAKMNSCVCQIPLPMFSAANTSAMMRLLLGKQQLSFFTRSAQGKASLPDNDDKQIQCEPDTGKPIQGVCTALPRGTIVDLVFPCRSRLRPCMRDCSVSAFRPDDHILTQRSHASTLRVTCAHRLLSVSSRGLGCAVDLQARCRFLPPAPLDPARPFPLTLLRDEEYCPTCCLF